MPKIKTHKTAAKRFKISGTGKLIRRQANLSHNLTNRAPARKRRLQRTATLVKGDEKRMKRMIGA